MITDGTIPPPSEIKIYPRGTYTFQLATYLKNRYPHIEQFISYFNPRLTREEDENKLSADELLYRVSICTKPSTQDEKTAVNYMYHYLKYNEGKIRVTIPTTSYIDSQLKAGYKALCLTSSNYYYADKFDKDAMKINYHFVVIQVHNTTPDTHYELYDPLCSSAISIKKNVFTYGLHISVRDNDVDSGSLIFFKY